MLARALVVAAALAGFACSADKHIVRDVKVSRETGCRADVDALKAAEERYVLTKGGGSAYGREADLVPGFIAEESRLHDIVVPGAEGRPYDVVVTPYGAARGCGTAGAVR